MNYSENSKTPLKEEIKTDLTNETQNPIVSDIANPVFKESRKNLIDGVPISFDTSYVIKTKKKCCLCKKEISEKDISENQIVNSYWYDFTHKKCMKTHGIIYKHFIDGNFDSHVVIEKVPDSVKNI